MSRYHRLQRVVSGEEALAKLSATLRKYDVGHLALYDGAFPYVVPLNHTYGDGRLIMHCGLSGKKLDLLRQNSTACYGVYGPVDGTVPLHGAEDGARSCAKEYESVICYGHARLVEDLKERRRTLGLLARDYRHAELKHAEEETCHCIVFEILEMTGRYGFHPQPKVIYHYAFAESAIDAPYLCPEQE